MYPGKAVVAGIAGTLTKTLYSYISSLVENEQVTEPEILGTIVTSQTDARGHISTSKEALTLGYSIHLLIGICFAYLYGTLWHKGIGKPKTIYGFLWGTVSGIVGAAFWKLFLRTSDQAPKVPLSIFLRNMIINHMLFGVTVAWLYKYINKAGQD